MIVGRLLPADRGFGGGDFREGEFYGRGGDISEAGGASIRVSTGENVVRDGFGVAVFGKGVGDPLRFVEATASQRGEKIAQLRSGLHQRNVELVVVHSEAGAPGRGRAVGKRRHHSDVGNADAALQGPAVECEVAVGVGCGAHRPGVVVAAALRIEVGDQRIDRNLAFDLAGRV